MHPVRRRTLVVALVALAVLSAVPTAGAAPRQGAGELVGTFAITAGRCSPGPTGSYFRMVHPTGTPAAGPYVDNADSACGTKSYTLLSPGTDGGLVTGGYQPAPSPGFDGDGNSLSARLIRPVRFFGVAFSASTDPAELQTGTATPAPSLRDEGGRLVGDLAAFAASWNKEAFNQGSPKPDGSRPGNTAAVAGTIDAATGAFALTWTSQIVGGAFNNFTGVWHLEGTFRPSGSAPAAPTAGAEPSTVVQGAVAAPAAAGTGATETDAAVAPDAVATVEESAPSGADDETGEVALAASVQDNSFEAPAWLVVLIALAGIGAVVALVFLGRRPTAEVPS